MFFQVDIIQTWLSPLLPVDKDTVYTWGWPVQPYFTPVLHSTESNENMLICSTDSLLSDIQQVGVGYHDAVADIAIPLIIALFAFAFMFLFDAVNRINDKYKSPKISELFENQASNKLIISISLVSIAYVLIYGLITLFFQRSEFWIEWSMWFDFVALVISIVYACEVVSFAKCCMRFNKPTAVLELIDQGVKLKPRTPFALIISLIENLKNRRNPERKKLHNQGKRLFEGFIEFELQKEHIKRMSGLLEYAMTHKEDTLIASMLNSLNRFVEEENKIRMDGGETQVIRVSYVHVYSNLFYDELFRKFSQHPQEAHVLDNIIDSYLKRFPHVHFMNEKDMASIVKHIVLCAESGNTVYLEKFIESSNRSMRYLKFLHNKAYVLGLPEEDKDWCIENETKCWEQLCNHIFIAFAYAVYSGCYSLIPSLVRQVGLFGHNLFPCTKADVLYRYLHCRKTLEEYAIMSGVDCSEAFGRTIDIEPIIAQYASLLLAIVKEDKMMVPFSSNDFGLLSKYMEELKDGSETIKGNYDAIRYGHKICDCDFDDLLGRVVAKISNVGMESYDEVKPKAECSIDWLVDAFAFPRWLYERLIKFTSTGATSEKASNYVKPVIKDLYSSFASLFCNNLHPFQNRLVSNMFGDNEENKNDAVVINPATVRIDKRFFLSKQLFDEVNYRIYLNILDVITNRILYAYLEALGDMICFTDEICVADVKTYLKEKTNEEYDRYALILINKKMLVNEEQTVMNIEIDTRNYSFLDQLPLSEKYNNSFLLIEKSQLPYLSYRDEGRSTKVNFTDMSSEKDGILDMAVVVDYGLSLHFNRNAVIRNVKVKPMKITL